MPEERYRVFVSHLYIVLLFYDIPAAIPGEIVFSKDSVEIPIHLSAYRRQVRLMLLPAVYYAMRAIHASDVLNCVYEYIP